MTASDILAAHALSRDWDALPDSARAATRVFLLDTLAVGMAGARAPFIGPVWGAMSDSAGSAVVFGRARRLRAQEAAFVNGFQIHAQEFDCVHEAAVVHPLATIVAALAAAAGPGVDGATFGAALVAAADVAVCLGVAARAPLKFFRPATAGVFGAAAGIARLKGLSHEQTVGALGHALAFASGTMQAHVEGMPGLPLQIAGAARAAVVAAELAARGMPGASGAIDGPFGYLTLFEDAHDLPAALDALGGQARIEQVSHKPFPTGRAAHGAIVALREMLPEAASLVRFVYAAPPLIARLVGRPARPGMAPSYARLCLPYLLACVLRRGEVGLHDFSRDRLDDPETLALAPRFSVVADANPDPAAFTPARAEATLADGRTLAVDVAAMLGHPARVLPRGDCHAKVRACCAFAGQPGRADALIAAMETFGGRTDMGELLALAAGDD